jgi:hypothetical protein
MGSPDAARNILDPQHPHARHAFGEGLQAHPAEDIFERYGVAAGAVDRPALPLRNTDLDSQALQRLGYHLELLRGPVEHDLRFPCELLIHADAPSSD